MKSKEAFFTKHIPKREVEDYHFPKINLKNANVFQAHCINTTQENFRSD